MAQRRLEKINELLRKTIAELLLTKSKDPRLKKINITGVKVTADLKKAVVHYSVIADEEEKKDIKKALAKASSFIRSSVSKSLSLKYAPEIKFEFDRNLEYAQRMSEIFKLIAEPEDDCPAEISELENIK